jgi:hypothetical protein
MTLSELALALWKEQIKRGIAPLGEVAEMQGTMDWLAIRRRPLSDYIAACRGDAAAMARVRAEAGLPPAE